MYLKLILLAIVIVGLAFAGIAIKMFFQKSGEFKKQCSSTDVHGNHLGCACSGRASSCEHEGKAHA